MSGKDTESLALGQEMYLSESRETELTASNSEGMDQGMIVAEYQDGAKIIVIHK